MPTKGRIPPFLVYFCLAFAFVGLVGFQILKERRTATTSISEKEFELENVRQDLTDQMKLAYEREKERNTAQDSLVAKDSELQNVRAEYDRTVENFKQLKKIVKQKEEEIVRIREQLQEYSFEKAKESAEQINNNHNNAMESTLESKQAEEHKPADEAGLDDRKGLQEIEEVSAKDADVSALEKEMDERSKPKPDVLNEGESKKDNTADGKREESSNQGDLQDEDADEDADEQDNADTRDLDEKETEASQEEDQHEESNPQSEMQTGDHEDLDAQRAEHAVDA